MRSSATVRVSLLVFLLLATAACHRSSPAVEARPPGPEPPDLAGVDDARQQIELLRSALESGAESGELADRFGELGNAYHIAELLDAAAEAYAQAGRSAPADVRWPYYLGMVHQTRGELEPAAASFERVLAQQPGNLAARLRLAEAQLRLNRLDAARESFAAVLRLDANSAAATRGLGQLASIDGRPSEAARYLERALELQPEASSLHYPLAQAYRKLGDPAAARIHLDQRGERQVSFPDPLAARLSRTKTVTAFALVAARAGDLDQLSNEDFLGFVIEQVGAVDAAPEQLAAALERGPSAPPASGEPVWRARLHYAIGGILTRRGADEAAIEHFLLAVELQPQLHDARLRLANALARLGRFEAAESHYSTLLESDPDDRVLLKRATARIELGRLDAATIDLRSLLAADSENGMARLRLGAILRRIGDRSGARHELERALAADLPAAERTLVHRQLAGLAMESSRPEEALGHFRAVIDLEPDQPSAWLDRGRVLGRLQRYADQRAHLEAATARLPDHAALKRELARLLASCPLDSVRDGRRSLKLAEALLQSEPSLSNAETLAMALAEVGRFEEAAQWQRKLLDQAEKLGYDQRRRQLSDTLARYQDRQPYRTPRSRPEGPRIEGGSR